MEMSQFITVIGGSIAAFLAAGTGLGVAFKGFVEWKYNPDSNEKKKGKAFVFGGLATFVLTIGLIIFIAFIWNNEHEQLTETGSILDSAFPVTTLDEKGDDNEYVVDALYDGARYTGFIDHNTKKPNGKGKMVYVNQNVYDGEWDDGIQHGNGVMRYYNGDSYDGKWENGMKNGYGVYTWSDGKQYSGNFVDDIRNGTGVFTGWVYINLDGKGCEGTYSGEIKDNHFEGSGSFTFDNGDFFDGIFKADIFWTGVYTRKDGSYYIIKNGKPS